MIKQQLRYTRILTHKHSSLTSVTKIMIDDRTNDDPYKDIRSHIGSVGEDPKGYTD